MKKTTIHTLVLALALMVITPLQKSYAGAVIGATFPQQILDNIVHVMNESNTTITALNTTASMLDQTVGRPLATAMINTAQQQAAGDILNWANGGFDGESLILNNVETSLKRAGTAQVKSILNDIPKNSIISDSVFGSLMNQYKNKSQKEIVSSILYSPTPSLLQDKFCDEELLDEMVNEELQDEDGNVDPEEFANRRYELYQELCTVNAVDDPIVAKKLEQVSKQRPELGSWDLLLATTVGGANTYTQTTNFNNYSANEKAKGEQLVHDKTFMGEKPQSQTKCLQAEPDQNTEYLRDENGDIVFDSRNEPIPDPSVTQKTTCAEGKEITITPGSVVQDSISKAANSGLDRLTNLTGEGLMGLIATFAIQKLTSGVNSAVQSTIKDIKSDLSGKTNNSTKTIGGVTIAKKDLQDDPATKTSMTAPMFKQLNLYAKQLDLLERTDSSYISFINAYESKITVGKSCYDSLVNEGLYTASDSQIASAYSFYRGRQDRIDLTKNTLTKELTKISAARNLTEETSSSITNSESSQEISKTFTSYSNTLDANEYPTLQTNAQREGELKRDKNDMESDFKDIPGNSEIRENAKTVETQCHQLRNSRNYNGGYGG